MIAAAKMRRAVGVAVLALIVGSCNRGKASPDVHAVHEAITLIERFVALDRAGRGFLPEADALFEECAGRVSDRIEPVLDVRVALLTRRGDMTPVSLSYSLVGFAFPQDAAGHGGQRWTFRFEPMM